MYSTTEDFHTTKQSINHPLCLFGIRSPHSSLEPFFQRLHIFSNSGLDLQLRLITTDMARAIILVTRRSCDNIIFSDEVEPDVKKPGEARKERDDVGPQLPCQRDVAGPEDESGG